MSNDTSGTSPEPEYVAEGDENQLPREDTLVERGVDDLLDEGYSPPQRDRANHFGETAWEEAHGEPFDRRLSEEEPEEWERKPVVDERRAGRILADDEATEGRQNDLFADDEGVAGGAASAEEAAVHIVDEP